MYYRGVKRGIITVVTNQSAILAHNLHLSLLCRNTGKGGQKEEVLIGIHTKHEKLNTVHVSNQLMARIPGTDREK
jgi:hypothetical protein